MGNYFRRNRAQVNARVLQRLTQRAADQPEERQSHCKGRRWPLVFDEGLLSAPHQLIRAPRLTSVKRKSALSSRKSEAILRPTGKHSIRLIGSSCC